MTPLDLFRRHLRAKVIALILMILIVGVGILMILNIRREAKVLVSMNEETARLLAGSIIRSIENGMLGGRPDIIRALIQDLKAELKDVRRLEVYRRNGVEAFTDLETVNQVNRRAGLDAEIIQRISKMQREPGGRSTNPLIARAVETMQPQEADERVGDSHVLTLLRPVRNLEKCQMCHGSDHQVRGVVLVSLGLDRLDADLKRARNRQIVIALLTVLGVAGALVIYMGRVVLQPIARTAEAARRIGGGDFAARVSVPNQDEIGDLGQTINDMAEHLQRMRNDLEVRNADLATALQGLRDSLQKVELLEQIKGELGKFVPESVMRLLERN
ncbi:MAG TPA: HAMP domain-containing protein, partial [Candidatus Acidoferrum sp.]|nr:HAMP domain-containing protein [Candidatus Acidoferrum sp.]